MQKAEYRKRFKQKRGDLSDEECQGLSHKISQNFAHNLYNPKHQHYHIFLSIVGKREVNTEPIIQFLRQQNKELHSSITTGEHLQHVKLNEGPLSYGQFQIPVPPEPHLKSDLSQINMVFIPLMLCDFKGNRIGYGKGYYDKFLGQLAPDCIRVGLSFFDPIEETIPHEAHDIPLHYLISPNKVHTFVNHEH